MAAFHLIIYGRFCVITEVDRLDATQSQPANATPAQPQAIAEAETHI
jgi:hypothetical protein